MTRVLIADASKPSLVMSSEVFKDKIPGAQVIVASTGKQAISLAAQEKPDLCLIDFDLPDVDGATLIVELREVYSGPILMTAFAGDTVNKAVNELLFGYNDASNWVKKPVKFDDLSAKIETFLLEKRRLGRRFVTDLGTQLIAKASGRGKRAPKAMGKLVNISLGGACVKLNGNLKMKKSQELTLQLLIPGKSLGEKKTKNSNPPKRSLLKTARTKSLLTTRLNGAETRIRATVAWYDKDGTVGLQFARLTDIQKKGLEDFLREI